MNQDNNNWRSEWYNTPSPTSEEHTSFPPADAEPHHTDTPPLRTAGPSPQSDYTVPYWTEEECTRQKKKVTTMRWIAATLCLLLVIAASAMLFTGDGNNPLGSLQGTPGTTSTPEGYADFKEFFDNYYDDSQTITGENTIPKAAISTGVTMPLAPLPEDEELTLGDIYDKCAPYVVSITAGVSSDSYHWGTGIVMTSDGYILTNTHVLDGSSSVTVTMHDDTTYTARLVGGDSVSDISVLKIDAKGLQAAKFCSTPVHQGDAVVAIGNPLGAELRGTMTDGIISAISRDISYNKHTMTLIQTNAAINEGNSGGPLINMHGQVIGITNMKMMSSSAYSSIEGIGFAIPVEVMAPIVNELIERGSITGRPAIGITVGPIPEDAGQYYNLPSGLYISEVSQGSDAEKKGVQVGDILTKVNGIDVTTTADVATIKDGLLAGDTLSLTIFRAGKIFVVDILLVETSDIY